jgi:FeS assembly SUF system protein
MSQSPATPSETSDPRQELEGKVVDALKKVFDPEIPVNIYELGLVYSIDVSDEAKVGIRMTLTAPACPVAGTLPGEVERMVKSIPGVSDAKVELIWDPPWRPDMMSKMARIMLGM